MLKEKIYDDEEDDYYDPLNVAIREHRIKILIKKILLLLVIIILVGGFAYRSTAHQQTAQRTEQSM